MFSSSFVSRVAPSAARALSTATGGRKVAVMGAAGGIGQPLSLLIKLTGMVDHLSLYDLRMSPGVAADVAHCNRLGKVTGHLGPEQLDESLEGCDVVVIPAGVPRKPGMTRDDLFNTNASIVKGLAEACAKNCPEAMVLIISNPVNSTVPIFAETLRQAGVYDPRRLFGVTSLDVVRANKFVADAAGLDPADTNVTVVGGHAGITILPILSQVSGVSFSDEEIAALTHRIQFGGDEVVQAKDGAGSATLSMAWAGAYMTHQVLRALNGEKGIVECTFVDSPDAPTPYFSTPVELGTSGVEKIHEVPKLSAFEQDNFDKMVPELLASIEKGIAFAKGN